jgi:cytochrome P450
MEGEVWGSNKHDFNPERFLDWDDHKASRDRRLVYMPFGGGRHLCPGRNLARAEILGIVSMLILSFEIEDGACPRQLQRPIIVPKLAPAKLGQGVGKPVYHEAGGALPVRFRKRKELQRVSWKVSA